MEFCNSDKKSFKRFSNTYFIQNLLYLKKYILVLLAQAEFVLTVLFFLTVVLIIIFIQYYLASLVKFMLIM